MAILSVGLASRLDFYAVRARDLILYLLKNNRIKLLNLLKTLRSLPCTKPPQALS